MTDEKNVLENEEVMAENVDEGENQESQNIADHPTVTNPELAVMTPAVSSLAGDEGKYFPCQIRVFIAQHGYEPVNDLLVANEPEPAVPAQYGLKVQLPGDGQTMNTLYGASGNVNISGALGEVLKAIPHTFKSLNVTEGKADYFRGQVRVDPKHETCLEFQLPYKTDVKPYATAYGMTFKIDCNTSAGCGLHGVIALATHRTKAV